MGSFSEVPRMTLASAGTAPCDFPLRLLSCNPNVADVQLEVV